MAYFDDLLNAWNVGKAQKGTISQPLSKDVAEKMPGFDFRRKWKCACGAELNIRAKDNRADGPSNFVAHHPGHVLAGHSKVPSSLLTWDGMAVERGWEVSPKVTCPACKVGMTVHAYKIARRQGGF